MLTWRWFADVRFFAQKLPFEIAAQSNPALSRTPVQSEATQRPIPTMVSRALAINLLPYALGPPDSAEPNLTSTGQLDEAGSGTETAQAEMCARCARPWPKEMFSPGIS
jgi:hypothetical protein